MLYNFDSNERRWHLTDMTTPWLNHLQELGAQFTDSGEVAFQPIRDEIRAAASQPIIAVLNHVGVIRVTGQDSEGFLQGQFSNDIKLVTPGQAQLTSWCSPKGRVLAQFIVVKSETAYFLLMPRQLLENTIKRLRMFVLRAQVTIEDVSATWHCLGTTNPAQRCPGDFSTLSKSGITHVQLPGEFCRSLLLAPDDTLIGGWTALSAGKVLTGDAAWQWLDIQAGLPEVLPGAIDEFVPQMLNLDVLGAVNFKKGCYPGQEIVARTHYLGKVKRRLYKAHLNDADMALPGQDIYPGQPDSQSAGKVVLAQPSPVHGLDILAVLQCEAAETGTLHLGNPAGPSLQLQSLPYRLDSDTP